MMARMLRAMARLNDHWIGDLLGSICLFGLLWGLLFLGYAGGFK